MSAQRSDARVLTDAGRHNAVIRDLRRALRANGIRSTKSARAQAAILHAAVMKIETPEQRFKRMEREMFRGMGTGEAGK